MLWSCEYLVPTRYDLHLWRWQKLIESYSVLFIITLVTFSTRLHRQRRDEMQPMQNPNSDLQTYPNNENMEPGAKAGPYVSSQPVQGFAHI